MHGLCKRDALHSPRRLRLKGGLDKFYGFSANTFRWQEGLQQVNLRTVRRSRTGRPAQGTSRNVR
jgi:hypothetical protein